MKKLVFLFFVAILIAGVAMWGKVPSSNEGGEHIDGQDQASSLCKENFSRDFKVKFPPINCNTPKEFQIINIPSEYIQSCSIAKYMGVNGNIMNKSDRSQVQIKLIWPSLDSGSKGPLLENEVLVNLVTYECNSKKDFDKMGVLQDFLGQVDSNGMQYYSEKEQVSNGLAKYSLTLEKRGYAKNIYIFSPSQEEENIIIRCDERICRVEPFSFLSGYLLSYSFETSEISHLKEMHEAILEFMVSKFK